MKKCLIFFTLLLITIGIAVLTEEKEVVTTSDVVAIGQSSADNLLEDKALSLD